MKKLVLVIIALLFVATLSAEVNLEALQAAHMNAMKYNGRADVLQQRDAAVTYFTVVKTDMASVYECEDIVTGYTVIEGKKIYWEITPIEGGFKITIKINIFGKTFEKSFIIKLEDNIASVQFPEMDERIDVDWKCLAKCGGNALQCIDCLKDWKCWAKCAGPGLISCIMDCF